MIPYKNRTLSSSNYHAVCAACATKDAEITRLTARLAEVGNLAKANIEQKELELRGCQDERDTLRADLAATRVMLRRVVEAAGRVCKYPGPDDWRILEDTLAAAQEEGT